MKIRNGFVTNSSSSSFILAFKDKDDFSKFKDACLDNGYSEVFELAKSMHKGDEKTLDERRKSALESLYFYMTVDKKEEYMRKAIPLNMPYMERITEEERIKETEEYKKFIEQYLSQTNYNELKKQIEEAKIIVAGTIWDSNGGLLEYAIRNGLLKEWVFSDWFISQLDVG